MRPVIFICVALLQGATRLAWGAGPGIDVDVPNTVEAPRHVVVAYSPLPLLLGRAAAEVVVGYRHHAVVLTPFYGLNTTAAVARVDQDGNAVSFAPINRFELWGGELGYRFFFTGQGPVGWFVGPSLIATHVNATLDGSRRQLWRLGGALDVGFMQRIAGRVALSLGAGVQVLATPSPLPAQPFSADLLVTRAVLPRLLLSVGVAL